MTREEFVKALEERGLSCSEPGTLERYELCRELRVWLGNSTPGTVEIDADGSGTHGAFCDCVEVPYAKALPLIDALIGVLSDDEAKGGAE